MVSLGATTILNPPLQRLYIIAVRSKLQLGPLNLQPGAGYEPANIDVDAKLAHGGSEPTEAP
jgi:hypothetical protein